MSVTICTTEQAVIIPTAMWFGFRC